MADMHPLTLIEYVERRKKPWFWKAPKAKPNALDTLIALHNEEITLFQAFEATKIPPKSLKQTLTLWGERLLLLKETLLSKDNKEVKAARLGVSLRQLNRLIKTYLPPQQKDDKPYKIARTQAQAKWKERRHYAVKVIKGDMSVVDAAKHIPLSERQMHRWMDKTLGDQFDLGLQQVRGLPKSFRNALAIEVETDHPEVAGHLVDYWRRNALKLKPMPAAPEMWKRENIRRCLVGLLTGQITLDELCRAKEADKRLMVPLLTGNLVFLGVSYEQASTWSLDHQEALADILNSAPAKPSKPRLPPYTDDSPDKRDNSEAKVEKLL